MNNLPAIKQKIADVRSMIEKSLSDINPETSTIKSIQQAVMPKAGMGTTINIQIKNIIGQQVIFNLTTCLSIMIEIENQLNSLANQIEIDQSMTMDDIKKAAIIKALEENAWVQKDAAKQLWISSRAMVYQVDKYHINHPNNRWRIKR